MNPALLLVLSLVLVVGLGISSLDVGKACSDVRETDDLITEKILKPTKEEKDQVFTDIRNYITALGPLYEALKMDKERVFLICKDVLELGTAKFMNIQYDYDDLVSGFNWTFDDMNVYRDLRDDTLTEWVKMEPIIFS